MGGDFDSFHAEGGSAALASSPLEVLFEVHDGVGVLSHCLTVENGLVAVDVADGHSVMGQLILCLISCVDLLC